MAISNFFVLLDDIAALLDDIAVMSKVAAQKTAGVLGDDLALNAQQVAGVSADRELPVVWAVAKGSFKNKCILIPLALAISAFLPWLVTPLLMVGGAYLCYEGFEKVWHLVSHTKPLVDELVDESELAKEKQAHQKLLEAINDPKADLVALEKEKISGAIRTDFVLSAEIITISLGIVASAPFTQQVLVLCIVGIVMTIGVYGLVGAIVKLDDFGLYLSKSVGTDSLHGLIRKLGRGLLALAPRLMKFLSVAGTIAMFLVGGNIIAHGVPLLHHGIESLTEKANQVLVVLGFFTPLFAQLIIGLITGAMVLIGFTIFQKIFKK